MSINYGLIGCGRIGSRHAEQMQRTGKLIAVCDADESCAEELGKQFNCSYFTDIEVMLLAEPSIELVAICTPNGYHAEHSIICLKSNVHVLCEQPLAIRKIDAERMIQAADDFEKRLYVVKQCRYNAPVMAVKNLLREDKLGKILSFQINGFWNRPNMYYGNKWRGTLHLDGGTLFTQFSHFIDLLYWYLGDVKNVEAVIKNYEHRVLEIEDTGVVLFEMINGAVGTMNYTVNSYQKNMEGSFTIFGEKGTVKIGGQYLNELDYYCLDNEMPETVTTSKNAQNYGFYQGTMSNHHIVYDELKRALQESDFEFAIARDGLKTIEIIEKIYQKATSK
jgi:predicted dehydrogenase